MPVLVITYYKKNLVTSLWLSFLCGTIVDLLASNQHLGLYALNYCLTTIVIFFQRRHFFADRLSTIPIMTFLFSFLSTLLQMILLFLFDKPVPISLSLLETDLLLMPLADSLYAFCVFTLLPFMPRQSNREYFFKN